MRYAVFLGLLNLGWEVAQLPLYTLWNEASAGNRAFAVAHCTVGDILIGSAALALALIAARSPALARWRWRRIVLSTVAIGVIYTVFSEWLNTALARWTYSALMPTLTAGGVTVGLAPLLQWTLIPPLALYLARLAFPQSVSASR